MFRAGLHYLSHQYPTTLTRLGAGLLAVRTIDVTTRVYRDQAQTEPRQGPHLSKYYNWASFGLMVTSLVWSGFPLARNSLLGRIALLVGVGTAVLDVALDQLKRFQCIGGIAARTTPLFHTLTIALNISFVAALKNHIYPR